MDIGHRSTPDRFARFGIVIGRAPGFNNHRPETSVSPSYTADRMVMPEHGAHIHIRPESLSYEFHCHDVIHRMIML